MSKIREIMYLKIYFGRRDVGTSKTRSVVLIEREVIDCGPSF
jgi:hypothetical protein